MPMLPDNDLLLVYDEECPVCSAYCRMLRIRKDVGTLHLVNARESSEIMSEITAAGLDIDQGMVLKVGERLYYGADAIHMLTLMSTRYGGFNRISRALFGTRTGSAIIYPIARFGRNLLLKLLGRTPIRNLED